MSNLPDRTLPDNIIEQRRKPGLQLVKALAQVADQTARVTKDPESIFRLYAIFSGDVERTALAANMSVEQVVEMADAGGWMKKIAVLIRLQKSGIPGDAERGVNRAINFVQADRLRTIIERLLRALTQMSSEELFTYTLATQTDKDGITTNKIHTRPFADLASALEKAHAMTYQALSDTATDRKDRKETPEQATAGEMHMAIADAMAQVRAGDPKAKAQVAADHV